MYLIRCTGIELSEVMGMGYQIIYNGAEVIRKQSWIHWEKVIIYSVLCFLVLCSLVYCFWPDGARLLEQCMYPGDVLVTKSALHNMGKNLGAGESVSDVLRVFCREILNGAQSSG